jgi:hypothetical protein
MGGTTWVDCPHNEDDNSCPNGGEHTIRICPHCKHPYCIKCKMTWGHTCAPYYVPYVPYTPPTTVPYPWTPYPYPTIPWTTWTTNNDRYNDTGSITIY